MKKFFSRFIACACSVGIAVSASITASAEAEEDFFPSGRKINSIKQILDSTYSVSYDEPAVSYIIFHGDETLLEYTNGYEDIENKILADEDTVYDWGSITKTLVWVSVFQLWEQGKIDLDADIQTYLPDGFFKNLSYDDPITMVNLMNHTGGWCETTRSMQESIGNEDKIPTLEQGLRDVEPAQTYRPGEVTAYSNYGAALAGYIVERISGKSFADYVHENIFESLEMEHTSVLPDMRDNQWVRERRLQIKTYKTNFMGSYTPKKKHNGIYYALSLRKCRRNDKRPCKICKSPYE